MFRLSLLALFVLVKTEDFLGVNYSFDIDFYSNFNNKKCGNINMWRLVTYESVDVKSPQNSDKAILAVGTSCASSFPIVFVGGTLEINVYSQDVSQMFSLRTEVLNENDQCITSYTYHRERNNFVPGWDTISFNVNQHFKGYIRLRGSSFKKILLIDSFRYTPKNRTSVEKRIKRNIPDVDEDEFIKYESHNYESEDIESSGDDEDETEDPPTDRPDLDPRERDSYWNAFTIALVSFAGLVALALVAVGSYEYGKVRARDHAIPFVDEEPPITITIPRVTGISNRDSPSTSYDFS